MPNKSREEIIAKARDRLRDLIPSAETINSAQALQLIEQLQIKSLELELQNEELTATLQYLQESEKKFRYIYNSASVGYLETDRNFNILQCNETIKKILQLDTDSLLNHPLHKFVYPEDQDILYLHKRTLLQKVEKQTCELRLINRNGSLIRVSIISDIDPDPATESTIYLTIIDLSQGITSPYPEIQENERLAPFPSFAPGIWFSDKIYGKEYWSESLFSLFEIKSESQPIPRFENMKNYFSETDFNQLTEILEQSASNGENASVTLELKAPGHLSKYIFLTCESSLNQDKVCTAQMGIIKEVFGLEHRTIKEDSKLQTLLDEKDKLISILSHDLRSPFHSLSSLADILIENHKTLGQEETFKYLLTLQKIIKNTFGLVTDLLELSLFKNGRIPFNPEILNLKEIADAGMMNLFEIAEQKNVKIFNKIPVQLKVKADKIMIKEVFKNLTHNAIKFSQIGSTVEITGKEIQDNTTEVTVSDHGIGIPLDLLPKLFLAHENTGRKGTNNEYTSGLGLQICKNFIEINQGKIYLESNENTGTDFHFTLPSLEK